jgi:hypothetical protein
MRWIVTGSSPTVIDHFEEVVCGVPDAKNITANAGMMLYDAIGVVPDACVIFDEIASMMFGYSIRQAQRNGMKLITMNWTQQWVKVKADVEITTILHRSTCFHRGEYVNPGFSGLIACQYALNNGATELILVGMDGYKGRVWYPEVATFDGRSNANGDQAVREQIQPFMQSMIDECPDVLFTQYGDPVYMLHGENYLLLNECEEVAA